MTELVYIPAHILTMGTLYFYNLEFLLLNLIIYGALTFFISNFFVIFLFIHLFLQIFIVGDSLKSISWAAGKTSDFWALKLVYVFNEIRSPF